MMLRDLFGAFVPGWHMNKEHWNTVAVDDSIPQKDIEQMTNVSCDLVIDQLPKKERLILELRYGKLKKDGGGRHKLTFGAEGGGKFSHAAFGKSTARLIRESISAFY
jgi:hypothetical protein